MPRINRRDLIASIGASAALLASRANASCDVWRDQIAGIETKSYQCGLGNGQFLTSTFMRLSDVMFDSAGSAALPGAAGDYQQLVSGHQLVQTPALSTFTQLFQKHSFAFEPENVEVTYDMRTAGQSGREDLAGQGGGAHRWRTLGVWDDTLNLVSPAFPLPDLLKQALQNQGGARNSEFLRFATRSDFQDLGSKVDEYTSLWGANAGDPVGTRLFGNLAMLDEIDAGSVDEFLPLFFNTVFGFDGCSGDPYGGAYYMPPALYVDVAVCRNDGTENVEIQDMIGAADSRPNLRPYNPSTPADENRFDWAPVTLAPGQSVLAVQRLIFGVEPTTYNGQEVPSKRAVYGPTHLPKGVIVNGQPIFFDGRSHNAVILASYANCCSCPYLESWCPRAEEWIEHGKVLTENDAPEKAGKDTRHFTDVRTHFRISEREHEDTTLTGAVLELTFEDGTVQIFKHADAARRLTIGESCELSFDVPEDVASNAVRSALTVSGHYEKFSQARFDACAARLAG